MHTFSKYSILYLCYLENDEECPEANEALQGRVKGIEGEEGYVLTNVPTSPHTTACIKHTTHTSMYMDVHVLIWNNYTFIFYVHATY